ALGSLLVQSRHVSDYARGVVNEELLAACVFLPGCEKLHALRAKNIFRIEEQRCVRRCRVLNIEVIRHRAAQLFDSGVRAAFRSLTRIERSLISLVVDDQYADGIRESAELLRSRTDSAGMLEHRNKAD